MHSAISVSFEAKNGGAQAEIVTPSSKIQALVTKANRRPICYQVSASCDVEMYRVLQ